MIDVAIYIYHNKMVLEFYPESSNSCKFSRVSLLLSLNFKKHTFLFLINVTDHFPNY